MKKNFFYAVAAAIVALCAVFTSCTEKEESYGNDAVTKGNVVSIKCGVTRIDYNTSGVAQTRSDYGIPEGMLDIVSYHKASWLLGQDTIDHTYTGRFVAKFYDVKRTRYASNIDIFKNPVMSAKHLGDSVLWTVTFKDTETRDFDIHILELPAQYKETSYQVGTKLMKLCQNGWATRELIDSKVREVTSPDEKFDAYSVDLYFQFGLEEGPDNKKTCLVTLPLVLVPKDGPDVPIPVDKHDVIAFEEVNKGYDNVNDSVNNRWIDLEKLLSNGSRESYPRVAFVSKNRLLAPERQIKNVSDFEYQSQAARKFDPVKKGGLVQKENNIYVQPMSQVFTTYTDKGSCVFTGEFDGQAYFIDSLGVKHYFLYKEYSFEDDGWGRSDLTPTENLERKLLKSDIRGLFNGATLARTGEIELRKVKGADIQLVNYKYKNFDIRTITPNLLYFTFAEQWAVFSNNKEEKVGEVGINITINTVSPEKQEIEVADWNINDLSMQKFNATRQTARRESVETGTFTVTPFVKKNTTRTNKSSHDFITTYDGAVVFKDKFGQEVTFKALDPSFKDKGGVNTLTNLSEENSFERKSMTSTLAVTAYGSDVSDHIAEVIFKKKVENEELEDWKVTNQNLVYNGSGNWSSTTTVTYYWKLAGTKTETYNTGLIWNIVGEAKSQVILAEAKADYRTLNAGSETSSTSTNGNITVMTKKKTYSEDYTTLTDKYTATKQTASYKSTVGGKTITFDFLAPTDMSVSHKDGSLVNGNRTTTKNGTEYDVWDHTGSVTATVTGNGQSQTQNAVDEKEILVKKEEIPVIPADPELGEVIGLASANGHKAASLSLRPNIGSDGKGEFYKILVIQYQNGIKVVHTNSYGPKAYDFTSDEGDKYIYGQTYNGVTFPRTAKINSAAYFDGRFVPALITMDGSGWSYLTIYGQRINCSQQLADTRDIKNFNDDKTAECNPWLYYADFVEASTLYVKNMKGVTVYVTK